MTEDQIIDLAVEHGLGRRMAPICPPNPSVFATEQGYRTSELLTFAAAVRDIGNEAADERAAFEAWAPTAHMRTERWAVNPELYDDEDAISAWSGWQARAAIASRARHTSATLEAVGNLVRTRLTDDGGGFLVAEFRDDNGNPHSDGAKANARLFVAAAALHDLAEQVLAMADINTPPALIAMAGAAVAAVKG